MCASVCMCVLKTENDVDVEENSRMYSELKAARETIEELQIENGFTASFTYISILFSIHDI